ncbi:MAG: hypothetical protein JXJ04_15850, partial [Spirochaetales bacterium]|nr:hypothetical protein [Spirochaetales bacterium]
LPNKQFIKEQFFLELPYTARENKDNVNKALILSEILKEDSKIAVFWAGSIPYYTDFYCIDFLGKCDKYIARLDADISGSVSWYNMKSVPGHNKYDLNYTIKQLKPDYAQSCKWGKEDLGYYMLNHYVEIEKNNYTFFIKPDALKNNLFISVNKK